MWLRIAMKLALLVSLSSPGLAQALEPTPITCGELRQQRLQTPGEEHVYGFTLDSPGQVNISVGDPRRELGLVEIELTDEEGNTIAPATCTGQIDRRLGRDTYAVTVRDCLDDDVGEYALVVGIETRAPRPFEIAVAPSGATAYTANWVSDTVSVIDLESGVVTKDIAAEDFGPVDVTVSPDGRRLYVASAPFAQIVTVDTATNEIVDRYGVGTRPSDIAVTADGRHLWIADPDPGIERPIGFVHLVDVEERRRLDFFEIGSAATSVALTPDEALVYATDPSENTVAVIDTRAREILTHIPVGAQPANVAFDPQGRFAYVTNRGSDSVSVIDTATQEVVETIEELSTVPCPTAETLEPFGIVVAPDGRYAYVTNRNCSSVSILDLESRTARDPIALILAGPGTLEFGNAPEAVALSPDGRNVYAAGWLTSNFFVIDATTATVESVVELDGPQPDCGESAVNDRCPDALELPAGEIRTVTDTTRADIQVDEPHPECINRDADRRAHSVWYRFTAPGSGSLTVDTFGSSYDTLLSVYTGACGGLDPVREGCDVNSEGTSQSLVSIDVETGNTYYVMASATLGHPGLLALHSSYDGPVPATPTPAPACACDCNADAAVTVDELVRGVQIALGSLELADCPAADPDGDGAVTVPELITAVNAALNGCL